ncbi:MAG: hypothetical protein RR326_02955 [Stenotrophomonas sp.]
MKTFVFTSTAAVSAYAALNYLYHLVTVGFGSPWLAVEASVVGACATYGATAMAEACYSQWSKK